MFGLFNNLKIKFNLQVQYLHCDNAGENQALKKKNCKQEGLGVDFEYTAPGMPQQNGCIPYSTRYMPCLMVASLLPSYEAVSGQKHHAPWESPDHSHEDPKPFQQCSNFDAQIWWNMHCHLQGHQLLG